MTQAKRDMYLKYRLTRGTIERIEKELGPGVKLILQLRDEKLEVQPLPVDPEEISIAPTLLSADEEVEVGIMAFPRGGDPILLSDPIKLPANYWLTGIKGGVRAEKDNKMQQENHKGKQCPYENIICQEGYCSDCMIYLRRMGKI